MAFTIDSLERDSRHELTGLPVGGVHSISLVALVDQIYPVQWLDLLLLVSIHGYSYGTHNCLLSFSSC